MGVGDLLPLTTREVGIIQLCDDHRRGNALRYTGRFRPRTDCTACWDVYRDQHPADNGEPVAKAQALGASGTIEDLKAFGKLDDAGKTRILLGEGPFRIVMYDIEATHLKPNVGRILCCSFKPLGGDVYTFDALEPRFRRPDVYDDTALALAIRDELESYDIVVGWNSKNFDTKFINSRLIRAGERIKRAQYQVDGMWSWRSKFNAWSGLDSVQKFARPQAETEKTAVAWEQWMRALGWDKHLREQAMAEIVDHCERDVIVLEDVYRLIARANVIRSLRRDGGLM